MAPRLGYLLPTRERIMSGEPETTALLELAVRAERLGWDSIWIGDSLLARPRHEPLTLLAAVAARRAAGRARHRRAAADIAQSGAAGAPGRHARPDRGGAPDPRRRHRPRRARHPRGVHGRRRAVREARRAAARRPAPLPRAVDRQAGVLGGAVDGRGRRAGADALSPRRAAAVDRRIAAGQPGARGQAFRRLAAERSGCGKLGPEVGRGAGARPRRRARSRGADRGHVPDARYRRGRSPRQSAPRCLPRPVLPSAGRGRAHATGLLCRCRRRARRSGCRATPRPAPATWCCASPATTSGISICWRRSAPGSAGRMWGEKKRAKRSGDFSAEPQRKNRLGDGRGQRHRRGRRASRSRATARR